MNSDRYLEWKAATLMLIRSSRWLTQQIDTAIEEFSNLPEDASYQEQDELLVKLTHLQRKSEWEDIAMYHHQLKYPYMSHE